MKIWKKFNTCTFQEYKDIFEYHKEYEDFNILWIYRSLLENQWLSVQEKIEVKELYNTEFWKTYHFLQVKDPITYFHLELFGKKYTKSDADQLYNNIQKNQQKILKDKKIKHRNFGTYSKHLCWIEGCPMDGMMIQYWWYWAEYNMQFEGDKHWVFHKSWKHVKSDNNKKERKAKKYVKEVLQDI